MSDLATGTGEDFYRAAFERAMAQRNALALVLRETVPYVRNVARDPTSAPWRAETAEGVLARVLEALGEAAPK